ncbi:MAG: hypothetical protein M1819_005317 [Sarea resinae]|nr:MAG: hypothetical protein M1819_005317 [Sarea resinae]
MDSRKDDWVAVDIQRMAGLVGLQTSRSSERLNQIDRVRAKGVGDHISLPQLVVCGDQSAGKSSVLEGITGIPFPRNDGVCTRFATEIILRHQPEASRITATIMPGPHSENEQTRLKEFRRELSGFDELPEVIQEASILMGIRGYGPSVDGPAFAADVLRLEVVGNTGLHLTVVDLPGLISVSDCEEDVAVVERLVDSYLGSSRTIILAVVQANNDIDTQGIIQRARRFDKAGERTVGIITKPDLINKGTESRVATLSRNMDRTKLKLGFFLLKNPSPLQLKEGITWTERANAEVNFFSSAPWKEQHLDRNRIGIERLRVFLQELLDTHIERELPKVRKDVKSLLSQTDYELEQLGAERSSITQMRMFLTHVSMGFYNVTKAALEGTYDGKDGAFFETSTTRLRALVHEENGRFATYMREHAEKRKRSQGVDSDIKDDAEDGQLLVTEGEFDQWVKETYHGTRGRELPGNYNHALLSELFHEQSSRWGDIAKDHLQRLSSIVAGLVAAALAYIIKDEAVRRDVQNLINTHLEANDRNAQEELQKILDDEKVQPITYNHYFTDNIQNSRQEGLKKQIGRSVKKAIQTDYNGAFHVSNSAVEIENLLASLQRQVNVDMDDQACSEAVTGLRAYYKVAMKTFVDNVCRQVIERHILTGVMQVFEPIRISEYTDEELRRLAAESSQVGKRRHELQALREALEESLRELRD